MKRRNFFGAIAGLFCLPWFKPSQTQEISVEDLLRVKNSLDENRNGWVSVNEIRKREQSNG